MRFCICQHHCCNFAKLVRPGVAVALESPVFPPASSRLVCLQSSFVDNFLLEPPVFLPLEPQCLVLQVQPLLVDKLFLVSLESSLRFQTVTRATTACVPFLAPEIPAVLLAPHSTHAVVNCALKVVTCEMLEPLPCQFCCQSQVVLGGCTLAFSWGSCRPWSIPNCQPERFSGV